ncbi:Endonuclease/exonuclease/phosphatase [Bacteroides coprosuis DSM 18011]|uniref:Endonuclease/exonuclease/phosphatase n=1 Tax=Bacteroides coprosuis DSM 18011 TaxID=679937 RepID=F3ZSZ3_9BACE|nr:endonuclease/exonuclease/phosphatase family protein [Bacteroides coprosuis]EGJ72234.1 Endonuclease/exonuclease/phosphatase [Bacteroides coprosuis DSM 18011]
MKTKLLLSTFLFSLFFVSCSSSDSSTENPSPKPPISQGEYPKESGDIRIVTYNVRHFENSSQVIEYNNVAKLIKKLDADVICFQEIDKNTTRSKKKDQMNEIAKLTHMYDYFSMSIPYQGGEYGNGILSKEKALSFHKIALPGKELRSALVVEFDKYIVISTHLSLESYNREESINILSNEAAKYKGKSIYLAGDLNEKKLDTPFFLKLKKYWNIESSNKNTYPTPTAKERIDYIISYKGESSNLTGTDVVRKMKEVNVSSISDHYPVFCDFSLSK